MKTKYLFIAIIALFQSVEGRAQQVQKAYTVKDLMQRASAPDTVYIINFWATYCMPCVAELHEFNTLENKFKGRAVKVILVSLDFKDDHDNGKLGHFIERKGLTSEVVWFAETDPNVFIPQIDNSWQGSIPATLMLYPGKKNRQFIEGPITAGKLKRIAEGWLK
jgi:thiol-disulfide isomerase/thioredoxin